MKPTPPNPNQTPNPDNQCHPENPASDDAIAYNAGYHRDKEYHPCPE